MSASCRGRDGLGLRRGLCRGAAACRCSQPAPFLRAAFPLRGGAFPGGTTLRSLFDAKQPRRVYCKPMRLEPAGKPAWLFYLSSKRAARAAPISTAVKAAVAGFCVRWVGVLPGRGPERLSPRQHQHAQNHQCRGHRVNCDPLPGEAYAFLLFPFVHCCVRVANTDIAPFRNGRGGVSSFFQLAPAANAGTSQSCKCLVIIPRELSKFSGRAQLQRRERRTSSQRTPMRA